jgi:hypothetical protein
MATFPNVGAVSGWPIRRSLAIGGNEHTIEWGFYHAKVEHGKFISDEEERDYAVSIGLPHDQDFYIKRFKDVQDTVITYKGVKAYATSQHCQMIVNAGRFAPLCKWEVNQKEGERPFDKSIDDHGLLRLTTFKRYTFHMGNVIDDKLRSEIATMDLSA